jgi:DNA helicase HerA-like ATPase
MRPNPKLKIEQAITELGVGEALVSLLDEKGRPGVTERAFVVPPGSQLGPLSDAERKATLSRSALAGHYEKAVDRESAYERLTARAQQVAQEKAAEQAPQQAGAGSLASDILFGKTGPRGGKQSQGLIEAMAKSAARTVGSQVGRELIRGVLGSLLGGKRR